MNLRMACAHSEHMDGTDWVAIGIWMVFLLLVVVPLVWAITQWAARRAIIRRAAGRRRGRSWTSGVLAWTHKRRADYPDREPCGRR